MLSHLEKNIYFYLSTSMVIWGIAWPVSKILTNYTDTFTLLFLKFFISMVVTIPMIFFFASKAIFTKRLVIFLIISVIFMIGYNIAFFIGIKEGYAGVGGVFVTSFNPIITFAIVALLDNLTISFIKKIALILGFFSGFIILRFWDMSYENLFDNGNIYFLFASLFWSIVTIASVKTKEFMSSILFTFYTYLLSSFFTFFMTDMEKIVAIFDYDYIFWSSLIFTTIISTGLATSFYFKASSIIGANNASSFIFLVPVVALFSSNIILNEPIEFLTLIGAILAITSIYLLNKKS